jgi:hypothetical protein
MYYPIHPFFGLSRKKYYIFKTISKKKSLKSRRLNTKSANVLENPLKKIYYYEITKLIGMTYTTYNSVFLYL